uniref:Corticotropin-releasing factor domain-containing protein n=1 Tax=Clastoptera arizonana TaxID=38151 RepID=A0A1B6BYX5_9HEMI
MAALTSTLLLAVFALTGGAVAYYDQATQSLEQLNGIPPPDSETNSFLIPRLAQKYRPDTGDWMDAVDPKLYVLTETGNEGPQYGALRAKRTGLGGGPSLSIVNPLDVLRQRLLLEIARRRMRQSEEKIQANREWLKTIGKRSADASQLMEADVNRPAVPAKLSSLVSSSDLQSTLPDSIHKYVQPRWASHS